MSKIDYALHKRENYSDPSPYPEVKVLGPNLCYSEILMDDYAGMVSEFTAISQYLYHYFYFKDIDKELGELLENVTITEMLHMEILADTIKLLGGNPMIRGSYSTCGNFWDGRFVYYGNNLCDRLKSDLDSEYKAIENYRKHIYLINDPYIKRILNRIILDEMVHIKLFNEAIHKFSTKSYARQIKEFTLSELSLFDGSMGKPAYIAVNGVVYDISNESTWGGATHFGLTAGNNLTAEFNSCHNIPSILEKLPKVGLLKFNS